MSIATEITRLQGVKADLKTAIEGKGVTVSSSATLDDYAALVDSISGGGGTDYLAQRITGELTSYSSDVSGTITAHAFDYCRSLTDVSLPNVTRLNASAFYDCNNLTSCYVPKVTTMDGNNQFRASAIIKLALPALTTSGANTAPFFNCNKLEKLDLGNFSGGFGNNYFNLCSKLNTLILRRTSSLVTLGATGAFNNSSLASGGSGCTIYIPKVFYDHLGDGTSSDYQSATNWSTVYGYGTITWAKIEGSYYETHYGDDTEIPTS